MPKKDKPTKGFEDVERVLDHLDKKYKEHRRREWLKEHYGKKEVKKDEKEKQKG